MFLLFVDLVASCEKVIRSFVAALSLTLIALASKP